MKKSSLDYRISHILFIIIMTLFTSCIPTAKFSHPMEGINGLLSNFALLNAKNSPTAVINVTNTPTSVKEGSSATFGVKLTGTISSDKKVTITRSNTSSVSVAPTSLTFTSSNATTDQIVTLTGLPDSNSISESFTITLTSSGLADVVLNITTTDDDCYTWGCFTDNENGTVSFTGSGTLAGTNLVWMKCSQGQTYDTGTKTCGGTASNYQYCSTLNNACDNGTVLNGTGTSTAYNTCNLLNTNPTGGYANRTDWRLPTSYELMSLIYCSAGPSTPVTDMTLCNSGYSKPTINSLFSNTSSSFYWSSSSFSTSNANIISFDNGIAENLPLPENMKTSSGKVRCVSTGP